MDLDYYDSLFDNAKVEKGKFASLPDGKYNAKINSVRIELSKKDQKPMIAWDLIISEGEQEGKHIFHNKFFANEDQAKWAKEEIWKLGIEVEKMSELKKYFPVLLNAIIEVTLKSKMVKGEMRQNVFINKLVNYAEV